MLISLLGLLAMTISAGIRAVLAEAPIILEGPSTLELGLIGGGVIVAYAIATRKFWRRRAIVRRVPEGEQLAPAASSPPADQPSRGAA